MDRETLNRILDLREDNRPAAWISRELGVDVKSVRALLRLVGDAPGREIPLDKYDQVCYFIDQNVSLLEIMRSTGVSHATLVRYFPNAGWVRGGIDHLSATRMGRKMRELEKRKDLL